MPTGRPTPLPSDGPGRPLDGLRVVDFSAFVAGPLGAEVLADLGAEVIKVEPPQGEAMRAAAYAIAACQRGKRSLAIDIGAPEARPVVDRLLEWADVVLHNFRVGVSERLGIDEAHASPALNPSAVYCHASAFGPTGPRAKSPGNDALMQALTGFERRHRRRGQRPDGGDVDPDRHDRRVGGGRSGCSPGSTPRPTTGRRAAGRPACWARGCCCRAACSSATARWCAGPTLDGDQTGYGPGYRIYRGADGHLVGAGDPRRRGVGSAAGRFPS